MSEFKEMDVQGDYSEKISTLATKLAVNRYNEVQGKNINLDTEISENIKLVNNKISQIYKEIQVKSQGLELPRDLNDTIAEYLLRSLEPGQSEITQIETNGSISEKIFFEEVLRTNDPEKVDAYLKMHSGTISSIYENEEKTQLTLSERFHGLDDNKYKQIPIEESLLNEYKDIGKIVDVFESAEGRKFVFIEPEDELDRIPEDEDISVEEEITLKEDEFRLLNEQMKLDPKADIKLGTEEYISKLSGLGIDAALRNMFSSVMVLGAIEFIKTDTPYSDYRRDTLYALLDAMSPENAAKNGYEEDSYTMAYKLGLYSRLLNDPVMQENGDMQLELREKLKKSDPEVYALLEKYPDIVEKMQSVTENSTPSGAFVRIIGTNEALDKESFLKSIEEFSEKNIDTEIKAKYTRGYDDYEEAYEDYLIGRKKEIEKIKLSEKIEKKSHKIDMLPENLRIKCRESTIKRLIEKKSVGIALSSVLSPEKVNLDKGQTLGAIQQLFDEKNAGKEGNYFNAITQADIEILEKSLKKLLDSQDKKKEPYIFLLGNIIKSAKERENGNFLNAENIKTEQIAEQYGGERTRLVTGKKVKKAALGKKVIGSDESKNSNDNKISRTEDDNTLDER